MGFAWRSFLLRPEPDEKRDLETFRGYTRAWMRPAAEDESGEFNVWAGDSGPPSHSVPPHLVAKAAARIGPDAFERVHIRLLRAYFTHNRDITDRETLRDIWRDAGLAEGNLARADDPALLEEVLEEHRAALDLGVIGVPAVQLQGREAAITGAYPAETYRRWIRRALEEQS